MLADGLHVRESVAPWNVVSGSAQIVTEGVATIPRYGVELTDGGPNKYSAEKSWYDQINARSAIGITRDGNTLVLFTVDVRGGSAGMKVGEVAEMLIRDYGVYDALNLDGGGSTTLAMGDRMVNVSSDNPAGRKVASSLAVFAEPVPQ
jgi:exopolysaccharide biosynthesis protein